MTVGLVVAGHGDLASALVRSSELIVGAKDRVTAVTLQPEDSPESLQAALGGAIDRLEEGAGVLVLIDLFGGTPGNAAALYLRDRSCRIVAGVNLPMLLEVLLAREAGDSLDQLATMAVKSGREGILDLGGRLGAGNLTEE